MAKCGIHCDRNYGMATRRRAVATRNLFRSNCSAGNCFFLLSVISVTALAFNRNGKSITVPAPQRYEIAERLWTILRQRLSDSEWAEIRSIAAKRWRTRSANAPRQRSTTEARQASNRERSDPGGVFRSAAFLCPLLRAEVRLVRFSRASPLPLLRKPGE